MLALVCAFGLGGACARPAGAQPGRTTATISGRITARPDSLVVSLITVGPGEVLWDRFGHTGIRVQNLATGMDSTWNWGLFDFDSPDFIRRFLTGDTRYWVAGFPTPAVLDYYRRYQRGVWEQELTLDFVQADSVLRFLRWNSQPENKFYRYDYYLDNCSTRARDALDAVLGGAIRRAVESKSAGVTWRGETLRLSQAFPSVAFGMSFTLGPRADVTLSAWEGAFLPMRLHDAVKAVTVTHAAGPEPLVRVEHELVPAGPFGEAANAPSYGMPALAIGVLVALLIAAIARYAPAPGARVFVGAFGSLWHLVVGLAGTLVLWAGLFTRHTFMGANTNVLLGTPVSLALAVLFLLAARSRAGTGVRRTTSRLAQFAAAASLVALALHVVRGWSPADISPVLLVAPIHAAFAYAVARRASPPGDVGTAPAADASARAAA
jgi:hypothetical protein